MSVARRGPGCGKVLTQPGGGPGLRLATRACRIVAEGTASRACSLPLTVANLKDTRVWLGYYGDQICDRGGLSLAFKLSQSWARSHRDSVAASESIITMRFKTHFKWNLSLFKRIIGPCHGTVVLKAGSINPLRSSSVVSSTHYVSHSAPSSKAAQPPD